MTEKESLDFEKTFREAARRKYKRFVSYLNPSYDWQFFHEIIADHLQRFAKGEIKKLMVTMPPQHGKSELSTRNFPAFLFGLKPDRKIAICSYSADKARKFSREVQQRFSDQRYKRIFPTVRLATAKDEDVTKTMQEFDVLSKGKNGEIVRGNCKAVGRQGPLTGDPVDIAILDDLFKDNMEAQSPKIRENAWDWIETVVESRLHNLSQILYVTTRWHSDDASGRWLDRDGYYSESNPNGWLVLNFPAIKTSEINSYDQRPTGSALWPAKHSLERMQAIQKNSSGTFNALYQGDPKPSLESLIFGDWIEIDEYPTVDVEFYGLDFGYSNDPTALTRIGKIGKSLYLDEMIYETALTNPDILQRAHLARVGVTQEVFADSAEPKSIEELKRGHFDKDTKTNYAGINAKPVVKGPGSISAGITKLKEYTVYVTKRSRNIIRERNNYTWIMAGGKATNVPIDDFNHAIDGIRSAVYTKYSKPVAAKAKASVPVRKSNSWR